MRLLIHPLFILTILIAIFFAVTDFLIALTVAVILHELAHALVAKKLGAVVSRITLMPFGGTINLQTIILTPQQKSYVYLAGPVASLMFSLLFGVIVWLFPVFFMSFEYLVAANFLVGVINLLPIYPLDGGKILSQYIPVQPIILWSNLIFTFILIIALLGQNWWWTCFAIILLLQINWDFKQSLFYDKFSYRGKQKIGKFVHCAVLSNMTLFAVYKMINKKHPTEFVVTDRDNTFFYENDLEQWLLKHSADTKLRQCF